MFFIITSGTYSSTEQWQLDNENPTHLDNQTSERLLHDWVLIYSISINSIISYANKYEVQIRRLNYKYLWLILYKTFTNLININGDSWSNIIIQLIFSTGLLCHIYKG